MQYCEAGHLAPSVLLLHPGIQTGTGKLAEKPDEIPRDIICNLPTFRPVPFCVSCQFIIVIGLNGDQFGL